MSKKYPVPSTWIKGFHDPNYEGKLEYSPLGSTGIEVSKLGFGCSAIAGHFADQNDEEKSIQVVRDAIRKGINYFDNGPWYGDKKAETILGKALEGIPREAYYVATKVGRYKPNIPEMFNFTAERTLQSVDESLQRLKLDYVDVIQVHDVEFAPNIDVIINETLPALQKVKDSGKAKYIGITGYPLKTLKEIIEKSPIKIDTVLSYCRCCLFDTALLDYTDYFKEKKLGIINAAGLGMGLLTSGGPAGWHPTGEEIKNACAEAAEYCKTRNVNIASLAVHYSLTQPGSDVHVISAADPVVFDQNLNIAINGLTECEQNVLEEINAKFFKTLTVHNWEGVELKKYWEKMKLLN